MRSQYEGRPHTLYMALDALAAEPMRCVLLRNLPLQTTAEKLEKKLRRNYALVGEMGTPTPLVSDSLAPFARNDDGVRLPSELLGLSALPAPSACSNFPPCTSLRHAHTGTRPALMPGFWCGSNRPLRRSASCAPGTGAGIPPKNTLWRM